MIIPSKFNGFHDGVRRCFGGGGGGGGGGDGGGDGAGVGDGGGGGGGPSDVYTPTYTNTANTGMNSNRGVITGMNFGNTNTGGYSGPGVNTAQGMATLGAAKGTPWGQSGAYYNDLLNQGFSSDQIRNSASSMYGAPSDANWGAMVQNAGMNSPTGRPMAGSDLFFQSVYNTSYQNYANPLTAFNVSSYGTAPARSNASQWWQNQGATDQQYMQRLREQAPSYQNMNIGQLAQNMQQFGISPSDMQAAGSYGGSTFGGFNPGNYMPQMQTPFNPYSGGYGGYGGYGGGYQPSYGGYSGFGMQSPFSYQQQAQPAIPPNYGPSQPIVSRSSQMRGTPNVMRRAEGGIASLMDKDK